MDEPTTGLHLEDIRKLAQVFDRLVDAGHTLVLIEHNLDVIKLADWVVDLGPEAGDGGGEIIAAGRPEEVAAVAGSHTGQWLRTVLPDWNMASGLRRAAHTGKPAIATTGQRRRARAS
jgi:excinuclease ABC subunit A